VEHKRNPKVDQVTHTWIQPNSRHEQESFATATQ